MMPFKSYVKNFFDFLDIFYGDSGRGIVSGVLIGTQEPLKHTI